MANAALARRPDFPPAGRPPKNVTEVAAAAASSPAPAGGTTTPANAVTAALDAITTYIPTEILTLYVAVLAALGIEATASGAAEKAFWTFLGLTPSTVWLVYAGKLKIAGKPLPWTPGQWPLWEMAAGTLAYAAWAFALPANVVAIRWGYPQPLAGVLVLIVVAFLGLLAPLFQRPLST